MKKLIILIFICSIFNLVTSDVPVVTQVFRQASYSDGECGSTDYEEHFVFGECYKQGSEGNKYFLMENENDNSTYVRREKFTDIDCQTTDYNTTYDLGCTEGDSYSYSYTLEPATGDILAFGSDFEENAYCDEIYEGSYMTDYCYVDVENEDSYRFTRSGNVAYYSYYTDLTCSAKYFVLSYTLDECKDWQDNNYHEVVRLIAETDSSDNGGGETDGGVVNSINFVLLFTFLIVNSLFFLN
ncbi:hypothetical protein M0813_09699 [Anaeramoeba flamelloides]|uniref:Uncharacterized protein n=1 Tax=Anaeramoeba flamelloides TaxID=1746091 RepID=A0ABQ8X544_9EUKA|nr:hypothetical protein M0813_09699 [Anaeramoeba flamelloides]